MKYVRTMSFEGGEFHLVCILKQTNLMGAFQTNTGIGMQLCFELYTYFLFYFTFCDAVLSFLKTNISKTCILGGKCIPFKCKFSCSLK